MEITFLGTGHGVPSAERATSSIMISVGDKNYYIDAGAPIAERTLARGKKIEDAAAIFTTHAHGDHIAGLYLFTDLYNWYYRNSEIDIYLTEKSLADALTSLVSLTARPLDTERIRLHAVSPDFVYDDGTVRVTLHETKHMKSIARPSYGILFEAEGKRLYFSGDLSQKLAEDDFPTDILSDEVDLFVCELAHFTLEDIGDRLDKIKAKRLAFNHVYPLAKYDDIAAISGRYPFEVLTPSDMDTIVI